MSDVVVDHVDVGGQYGVVAELDVLLEEISVAVTFGFFRFIATNEVTACS